MAPVEFLTLSSSEPLYIKYFILEDVCVCEGGGRGGCYNKHPVQGRVVQLLSSLLLSLCMKP